MTKTHQKARFLELESLVRAGAFDPETKRRFDARFDRRLVVAIADHDSDTEDLVGFVVGFKPGDVLLLADSRGKTVEVKLHQLRNDPALML